MVGIERSCIVTSPSFLLKPILHYKRSIADFRMQENYKGSSTNKSGARASVRMLQISNHHYVSDCLCSTYSNSLMNGSNSSREDWRIGLKPSGRKGPC